VKARDGVLARATVPLEVTQPFGRFSIESDGIHVTTGLYARRRALLKCSSFDHPATRFFPADEE
jgi:hypothetical protein